jgi:hypothetical protein
MPDRRATGGYKETKFHRVDKGVGFAHITACISKDNITLGEGRGNTFTMLLKERRKGDCGNAINSEYFDNSGGSYTGRPSESESLWKKMIGKPYSGKPNVRFDEGELEIEPFGNYASSLLY